MNTFIICTLFENHYHYGLAALTNSLYRAGFKGEIYAGYRGNLPNWAQGAKKSASVNYDGCCTLFLKDGLQLHFLPLHTDYHLTNYKPIFLLHLLNDVAKDAKGLIYLDPDILVKCRWSFFEEWCEYGVALVHEIVSNDMPATHPIRLKWAKVITDSGRQVTRQLHSYINGGFCGVARKDIEFLNHWNELIEIGISEYGCDPTKFSSYDKTHPFYSTDQDAINMSAMCSNCPISEMGPEAMDFISSGWTMSHATGTPKPWKKSFIGSIMKGKLPSRTDKLYWQNCLVPIRLYNKNYVRYKKVLIIIVSFLGRFYRKN